MIFTNTMQTRMPIINRHKRNSSCYRRASISTSITQTLTHNTTFSLLSHLILLPYILKQPTHTPRFTVTTATLVANWRGFRGSSASVLEAELPDGSERHHIVLPAEEEGGVRGDDRVGLLEHGGVGDAAFGVAVEHLRGQDRAVVELHVAAGMHDLDEHVFGAGFA